jgi:hypothetical protein
MKCVKRAFSDVCFALLVAARRGRRVRARATRDARSVSQQCLLRMRPERRCGKYLTSVWYLTFFSPSSCSFLLLHLVPELKKAKKKLVKVCITPLRSISLCGGAAGSRSRDWGFPTESFPRAETHIGLRVKCPWLLSNFNQNWNVLTNLIETLQIEWKSV